MVVIERAPENKPTDYLKYEGEEQWWTTDPAGEAKIQGAETGSASFEQTPVRTVHDLFLAAVKKHGKRPALKTEAVKDNKAPPVPFNNWKTWTWKQYYDDARSFSKAAISLGMEQHDSVNVYGFNSPEWGISTFGAIFAGGKLAGIYPTDTAEQVRFKCDQSNGAIVVLENEKGLDMIKTVADQLPVLKAVVTWNCPAGDDITTSDGRTIKTYSFEDFIALGRSLEDVEVEKRIAGLKPGNCCALVYTSGTTGNPKATMITHDNLHFLATSVIRVSKAIGLTNGEERALSYLPLSHIAGMMVDFMVPVVITSNMVSKGSYCTAFARADDLKTGKLVDRLQAVQPTFFLGVPRVWEKIMEKLKAAGASTKGLTKKLAGIAKKNAGIYTSSRQIGKKQENPNMLVANIVLKKIHKKLGLNKVKFAFSGAAPIGAETLEFFGSLGISINDVYGMSETTGVVTWSTNKYHLWGSIGFEIPGVEVKIFKQGTLEEAPKTNDLFNATEEEQGEVCFRGRNIMLGYMANPRLGEKHVLDVEQKNKEAFMEKGWLKSGDKGTRDVRGMYKITGRYKELILTAGGENIAPVPIEDSLKRNCPLISNAVMVGNKRKYNIILVTLKTVGATGELPGSDKLDGPAALLSTSKTVHEAMNDEAFYNAIRDAITKTNGDQDAVVSNASRVQKFTILPRDLSVLTGEFTPTLKLKRAVVEDTFLPIIEKIYESAQDDVYINYNLAPTPGLQGVAMAEALEEKETKAEAEKADA